MSLRARIAAGCRALVQRRRVERELDDELAAYLEAAADEQVRAGMTPEAARRTARAAFGSVAAVKDHTRDAGWESSVEGLWQDVRYALRALRRAPGFAATVFLTLTIAIAGNTAIFQLADAVRLRPLPVDRPEQLFEVRMTHPERGRMGTFSGRRPLFTYPLWDDFRHRQRAFSAVVAWGGYPVNVAPGSTAQFEQGLWVNGGFFTALGITPHLGRLLTEQDDRPGCAAPVAVLGYAFWRRQYGGDPSVIGKPISLDGHPFEIVGVAPRAFVGLEVGRRFDVATPLCAERVLNAERSALVDRAWWWLTVVGRLAPGWTASRASAHLASISAETFHATLPPGLEAGVTDAYRSSTLGAYPASTGVSGTVREEYTTPLSVLLGLSVVVLLIASANIATLLLARATARERDAAVRLALGASRARLVRQLLMESAVLAALGALAGTLAAQPLSEGLVALLQSSGFQFFAIGFDLQPNWRVLAFSIGAASATCLLFGLVPALLATRPSRSALVRGLTRAGADARPQSRLRAGLVVAQISLALMLVVAALLLTRTLRNLATANHGFDADDVIAVVVQHPDVAPDRRRQAAEQLLAAVRAMPGAPRAATASMFPLSGESWSGRVVVDGVPIERQTYFNRVSDDYFATLGMRFLAGRDFSPADGPAAPRVAIVNTSFARELLRRANPIGATFAFPPRPGQPVSPIEVIGVVADARHLGVRDPFEPMAFFPISQQSRSPEYVNLLVKLPPAGATRDVIETITRVEPTAVLFTVPLQWQIADQTVRERLLAVLSSTFAAVAALLALLGLYGAVAYGVAQRVQEIGIRMALGARGTDIVTTFLRQSLWLSGVGVVAGVIAAAVAAPYLESLLFGLNPRDPAVFVVVAIAFPMVAMAAAYVPARRATRIDPVTVLRGE